MKSLKIWFFVRFRNSTKFWPERHYRSCTQHASIWKQHSLYKKKYQKLRFRGRFPADREGMSLTYFPENQGIPLKYFPFQGGNYHSPLVAVKV